MSDGNCPDRRSISWRDLRRFRRFFCASELPRRDADEALEVTGELALVREAGVQGDFRQGQVRPCLQELVGPLDAMQRDNWCQFTFPSQKKN